MASLKVTLVGLDRITGSIGLALKRYMKKGGKHTFEIIGHDYDNAKEKDAQKMGAIDHGEHDLARAVAEADLIVLAVSYEDIEETYKILPNIMRDGAVLLDLAPLKQPSLDLAKKHLTDEQHLVGITPILNPRYLFENSSSLDHSTEDLFDDSAILLTPATNAIKAAVDLAFNFASILGSKPRFLDPLEHDAVLGLTEGLPRLLGIALFQTLLQHPNWNDVQWFTNPGFGALTQPLFDTHPDALRDEFTKNSDSLARGLDQLITVLQAYRTLLSEGDAQTLEQAVVTSSEEYEKWINLRYKANWDEGSKLPDVDRGQTIMSSLFGSALTKRLTGDKKQDNDN
jgi:prephenate dehydrogenase